MIKIIGVEEHYTVPEYMDYLCARKEIPRREIIKEKKRGKLVRDWLTPDLSTDAGPAANASIGNSGDLSNVKKRLRDMDEAGITMQVLSTGHPSMPDIEPTDAVTWAKKINDELAQFINKHPDRFAGFARVPVQVPAAAVDELERAAKLGLNGVITESHVKGEYLDDRKYWPIFEKAEELGMPIYLHPREPSPQMIKPYLAYPGLPGALWGYAAEASLHAVRLICSGVFDKYPGLKIILGHLGEALPFWLWRLDSRLEEEKGDPASAAFYENLKKNPSQYFKENFYVTTSGMFWEPVLKFVCSVLGTNRVLFAVDYPYESSKIASQFIESTTIDDGDKAKICHLNAEKLLGL